MSLTETAKELKSLNTNKTFYSSDIPTKILKQNIDFFSFFILSYVNKLISSSTFPSILKLSDITSVYEKVSQYEKSNYQPISILPNLLKIFENFLYDQISSFLKIGFQNGFNRQGCLVEMIEKNLKITISRS